MKATLVFACLLLVLLVAPTTNAATQPLRVLAPASGIQIGAAVAAPALQNDPGYAATLAREFSMVVTENALKFGPLRPSRDQYNFGDADAIINFAQANGMQVRGHTLVWHNQLADWLTQGNFSRDEVMAILHDHIQTVMSRYRGRIVAWDVVNEAFEENGSLRNTFWLQKIGPEYIEMAFRWAHEADPQALLFYNDYNNEVSNAKSDAIYRLMQDFVNRGVPVHGVGFQMHVGINWAPNPDAVSSNMERLAQLGLQVQITEMDVQIQNAPGTTEERLNAQAQVYHDMMSVCLNASRCTALLTWGVSDQYSWIPGFTGNPDAPLLFDSAFQPKPAYNALADLLTPQVADPTGPAIRIDTETAGGQMQVLFRLFNVADLYGLQSRCTVNPAMWSGVSYIEGDGFNAGNSFFVDQGYNAADGSWLVAVSRLQPNPVISGTMTAFGLTYNVQNAGDPGLNCSLMAVNLNGETVPLEVVSGAPPPVAPPAVTPVMPPPPEPTAEPPALSTVSGVVMYQNSPDDAGITVRLLADGNVVTEADTAPDGRFQLTGIPVGAYTMEARAPQHLPVQYSVLVSAGGETVELGSAVLPSGDTDDSGTVDILDATLIGANLGVQTPPAPPNADLNRDQIVNVSDLVLVGGNFGLNGPVIAGS